MNENIEIKLNGIGSCLAEATAPYLGEEDYGNFRGPVRNKGPKKDMFTWSWAYDDRRDSTGQVSFSYHSADNLFSFIAWEDDFSDVYRTEKTDLDTAIYGFVEQIKKIPEHIDFKDRTVYNNQDVSD
ncbi:MAG: hypothetical protein ABIF08_01770 [Nanoarchaeota archaeon]